VGLAVALTGVLTLALGGCASGGTGDSSGSEPAKLTLAHYLGPANQTGVGIQWFIDELAKGSGALEVEPFWEGSLLAATDILPGVADGRADIGFVAVTYHPSELPLSQFATLPFVADDASAIEQAFNDVYDTNEAFRGEYEAQGVKVLTFVGIPATVIAGSDPMPDLASLDGKKIRATGYTADVFTAAGSNVLALSGTEIYESIERGLLDGYSSVNLSTSVDLGLQNVAPSIQDAGLGVYGIGVLVINSSVWDGLTDEERSRLDAVSDEFGEEYTGISADSAAEACTTLTDAGIEVNVWEDDEVEKWRDLVGDSITDKWLKSAGPNASTFRDDVEKAIDKASSGELQSDTAACAEQQAGN
jgi:TRAP-type C4-dicarboxylate transport system substrate-binding protein